MTFFNRLFCFWIFPFLYVYGLEFQLSDEIQDAYYCAICVPHELDENTIRELGLKHDENAIVKFYSLVPVETFWGSLEKAKLSLDAYPLLNQFKAKEILVILRDDAKAQPHNWIKKYISVASKKVRPEKYLLVGKDLIGRDMLIELLKHYSPEMRKRFPLDK